MSSEYAVAKGCYVAAKPTCCEDYVVGELCVRILVRDGKRGVEISLMRRGTAHSIVRVPFEVMPEFDADVGADVLHH
jgi:hypothetical protein